MSARNSPERIEAQTRAARASVRIFLDEGHPFFGPSVELSLSSWARRSVVLAYLRYLGAHGLDPCQIGQAEILGFLAVPGGVERATKVSAVRRLYRRALADGLVGSDPTAGIHYDQEKVRGDKRLTAEEVRNLVYETRKDVADPNLGLTVRRDLVLIALGLLLGLPAQRLTAVRWGDVSQSGTHSSVRINRPDGTESRTDLPPCVATTIEDFRLALRDEGVDPVPEDALLPSLFAPVRFAWADDPRAILVPVIRTGLSEIINKRLVKAGIIPKKRRGVFREFTSLEWLGRSSVEEVEAALSEAAVTRVPRFRPVQDG
jgi:integrase